MSVGRWLFGMAIAIAIISAFLRGCASRPAHALAQGSGQPPSTALGEVTATPTPGVPPGWSLTPVALPSVTPTPVLNVNIYIAAVYAPLRTIIAPPVSCGGAGEDPCS